MTLNKTLNDQHCVLLTADIFLSIGEGGDKNQEQGAPLSLLGHLLIPKADILVTNFYR